MNEKIINLDDYRLKTHHDEKINTIMSCFKGYIHTDFFTLCELFGYPEIPLCTKSDVEWELEFKDKKTGKTYPGTIYNWRNGKRFLGKSGLGLYSINTWHVGGFDSKVVELVRKRVEDYDKGEK